MHRMKTGVVFLLLVGAFGGEPEANYSKAFSFVCALHELGDVLDLDNDMPSGDQILVADSLVTLDPFPYYWEAGKWQMFYDKYPEQTEISIYRAVFLRPIRTIWHPALSRFPRLNNPRGILFFSRPEHEALVAELFPFHPDLCSYEEYYTSTPSLKILLFLDAQGSIAGNRTIKLMR